MIRTILVVCVGNICRSSMAQYLIGEKAGRVTVTSAGLDAIVGAPPDRHATRVMSDMGIDISAHRARQISKGLVSDADLILSMETTHRHEIMRRYPGASGKVFRLGEIGQFDVADPYGKSIAAFHIAFESIRQGVDAWVPRIKAMA